jgi:hypothetical protein
MSKKIIRHEMVSILIPANSTLTRFNIPDLPNLRNVHIFGLEVYNDEFIRKDIISLNPVLPSANVLKDSFITLVNYGGKEFLKQAPSQIFSTILLGGGAKSGVEWDIKSFVGQKVNYPKSFVEFTAPPSNTYDQAYIFSVYYSLPFEEEKRDSGYSFGNKG